MIQSKYPQIRRAFIDGSQAADSDLDILVELNAPMRLQFVSMIQELQSIQ